MLAGMPLHLPSAITSLKNLTNPPVMRMQTLHCRAYFYFRPHFRSNATTSTFASFSPSQNKLKFLPPMRPMPDVFISRWLPCIPAFPSTICRLVILPLLPVSSSENHFWRRRHDSNLPIIREQGSQLIRKQICLWQPEGKKEQASGSGVHFFIMHIGRTRGGGVHFLIA